MERGLSISQPAPILGARKGKQYNIRPCVTAGSKEVYYTQSKDGRYVYAFLTTIPKVKHSGVGPSEKKYY